MTVFKRERILSYDGIPLLQVDGTKDRWHGPGRRRLTTAELLDMAERRDVSLVLRQEKNGEIIFNRLR